jgi:xanthine dehydrogenase accessory factor
MHPTHPSAEVLSTLQSWLRAGLRAALATVRETYGTSPRPTGSLAALCEDGRVVGAVSGGCVEELLSRHVRAHWASCIAPPACELLRYGRDEKERQQLRLPCGKQVSLCVEYAPDLAALERLLHALQQGQRMWRSVRYADGQVTLRRDKPRATSVATAPADWQGDAQGHQLLLGPSQRLFLIGANDVAAYMAPMSPALGFELTVCEPRPAYRQAWRWPDIALDPRMPDDLLRAARCDADCAVVAVSHDPRLDDLALIEALCLPCFYVGVIGSRASVPKRHERLAMFDITAQQLARLHSPAGLPIGSRTPPQIAISVWAELVATQQARRPAALSAAGRRPELAATACGLG